MAVEKEKLKNIDMKRDKKPVTKDTTVEEPKITQGVINRALDLGYNPSREKMREFTIIDRMQGRLFPLIDMIQQGREYILKVASYRMDPEAYLMDNANKKPEQPDMMDNYLYRVAQWQKSVQGINLKSLNEIIMTEMEVKAAEEDQFGNTADAWKD